MVRGRVEERRELDRPVPQAADPLERRLVDAGDVEGRRPSADLPQRPDITRQVVAAHQQVVNAARVE